MFEMKFHPCSTYST